VKKESNVFSLPMTQTQPPECPANCHHYQTQNPANSTNHFQRKETKHQHNSTLNMPSNDCGAIRSPTSSPHVPNTPVPAPSSSLLPSSRLYGSEQLCLTSNQQDPIKTLTESANELANSLNELTDSINELTNTLSNVIYSDTVTMHLLSLVLPATVQDSKPPVSLQPLNIKPTHLQLIYEYTQKAQQRFLTRNYQICSRNPFPRSLITTPHASDESRVNVYLICQ
jgi:hypothetical protein